MKNLTDISEVRSSLERHGVKLSKGLGQNFLVNPSVCPRMAELCGADEDTGVLEIGPGIGVLTVELAKLARKVVSVELDERLRPILEENLADFPNAEVVWGDVMKLDLAALIADRFAGCEHVVVCANLPYYITSPVIMLLLESRLPVDSITVMVQREAAERMCAPVGSRASGAVTVAVRYYSLPEMLFGVSAGSFLPPPKVDSEVMRLTVEKTPPVEVADEKKFFRMIKSGFAQRRKTLTNALGSGGFDKEQVGQALDSMGLQRTARIEELSLEQLAELSGLI